MITKQLPLLLFVFVFGTLSAQVSINWQTEAILDVPESVKYYAEGNYLFVSNISGKPAEKNGNGFISKLSLKGEIMTLKWVEGLDAPKGMAIKDGILYVTDIDDLVLIDIAKGKIIKRFHQDKANFLNDVTITHLGDVLVSDSGTSTVFILKDNNLDVWLQNDEFGRVNGLFTEKDYILLGTATSIVKIDVATKQYSVFLETGGQPDGLLSDGEGGYYYSFWQGELFHYTPGHAPVQLLNTSVKEVQTADFGFNPHTKEILVPNFFSNQVVSYTMN
ncbi:hypothetical protein [Carboxylicivirga marina]|uniref:hypothetical protein n=1 Tax=Carboxylicivirga marina TaxID=2800988 RepID=UPI002597F0C8|nr:hypothetical protein [uncultured Carboxylicivirga sp.]